MRVTVLLLVAVLSLLVSRCLAVVVRDEQRSTETVKLDFYVMSKCPDAAVCESVFGSAVQSLAPILELRVNYIARHVDGSNITCPHGPSECVGDKQQLCAQLLSPSSTSSWWNFTACQSQSRTDIPGNAEACATASGLSYSALSECVDGAGESLLYASALSSQAAGQGISCTLSIDGQQWCQHNGDWVGCDEGNDAQSLITAVCNRYRGDDKPKACSSGSSSLHTVSAY